MVMRKNWSLMSVVVAFLVLLLAVTMAAVLSAGW
jgi:hypothetical protein